MTVRQLDLRISGSDVLFPMELACAIDDATDYYDQLITLLQVIWEKSFEARHGPGWDTPGRCDACARTGHIWETNDICQCTCGCTEEKKV